MSTESEPFFESDRRIIPSLKAELDASGEMPTSNSELLIVNGQVPCATHQSQLAKDEPLATSAQSTLPDFGLYKCELCGKMVMGYDRENHAREVHGGKVGEWKKVR